MRTVSSLSLLLLLVAAATAQDRLISPYQPASAVRASWAQRE